MSVRVLWLRQPRRLTATRGPMVVGVMADSPAALLAKWLQPNGAAGRPIDGTSPTARVSALDEMAVPRDWISGRKYRGRVRHRQAANRIPNEVNMTTMIPERAA